jgi:transcriptional regulator with XRE-family HTH domain
MPDRYEGRDRSAVGARLELSRQALGIDQGAFAQGAGLKGNTYNQYETGTNMPRLDAAHALCDTYHLTLDWIYRGDPAGLRYDTAAAVNAIRKARSLREQR